MNTESLLTVTSLNQCTAPLVESLLTKANELRLSVTTLENQCKVIDAGINAVGGIEAGRQIAEICMGGLGTVKLRASTNFERWSWHLDVYSSNPVLACLASQYAGWSLSHGEGKSAFNALGSGPARAIGRNEPLFDELGYRDKHGRACLGVGGD